MLAEVVRHLRCPVCRSPLTAGPGALACPAGHGFDIARPGYAHLLAGRAPKGADTPAMVAARADLFTTGAYDGLIAAVADAAAEAVGRVANGRAANAGIIVDAGAGTGHYLAAVLDRLPGHHGLALDVAKAAARHAARAHPRATAAVCDVWRELPVADGRAVLLLDVFAPRNGSEFARVLAPTGALLVVTPRPEHLAELVARLGLLGVDPDKDERLEATLGARFRLETHRPYVEELVLTPEQAALVVAMGPSAWHAQPAEVAGPVAVTLAADVRTYSKRS